ncbi:MSHA biogenesis protein MshJ [Noviherbaspirillum aerium]|uniref:MSHA biogenesis protein MshJ n=1 Tax=Noviherbaspirillum aerium TaxID=2588497 RepID=UPI001CEF5C85|nr:MSHA biogenesis protein MshJ [Noviherbaspirillum aerium]
MMKAYWKKFERLVEARSMRERLMLFAIAALLLVTVADRLFIGPQFASQQQLSQKIKADQLQLDSIHAEIKNRISAHQVDPDAAVKLRLAQLNEQRIQMRNQLEGMQNGLVSPDRMAVMLEDLLKRDGKLRLKSLKTLPVASLAESIDGSAAPAGTPKPAADKAAPRAAGETVYKHGVEIVVEGGYADIAHYLAELERMPWQLFWAGTRLDVEAYPTARLTLTLFTLSLDKSWLNI